MEEQGNELSELQSNKRNRKIEITDAAISKVPMVEYKGIPEEHYLPLQEIAKMVLETARDENDCNEVAYIYSLDGTDLRNDEGEYLAVSFGDEHSVYPESDTDSMHLLRTAGDCVLVLVHNHPSLSKISLQDVSFMLRYETVKMVVVVTNRGSINYVVKTDKFDWDKASDLLVQYGKKYLEKDELRHRQKVTDDFLSRCHECGFLYDDH